MDTSWVHLFVLLVSFSAMAILLKILVSAKEDRFIIKMITLSLFLMTNIFLFSLFRVIFIVFSINPQIYFFNWWSLFIRVQNVISVLWISILAYRRGRSKL